MKQNTGAARRARIAIRLGREDRGRIVEAVKARGKGEGEHTGRPIE